MGSDEKDLRKSRKPVRISDLGKISEPDPLERRGRLLITGMALKVIL